MTSPVGTQYTVELLCDYPQWWRFNVFIMVVGYDADGENPVFTNMEDKIYDSNFGGPVRIMPAGYPSPRVDSVTTPPCVYADIYLYVIPNTFPQSNVIRDSPPFTATLRISAEGRVLEESEREVNQWGGLTIVALRADARG